MEKKNFMIGFLAIMILASGIVYVQLSDQARLRVDEDKTTFYVPHEEYSWIWTVSGREELRILDGAALTYRDKSRIVISEWADENYYFIQRNTTYLRGHKIVDTYSFDGELKDVESFPVEHKIEVYGAKGLFIRYTLDDLDRDEPREKICNYRDCSSTSLSFGKNMEVDFQEELVRWAWEGWPYGRDSFSIQYDIPSDYEVYNIRFFDPPNVKIGWLKECETTRAKQVKRNVGTCSENSTATYFDNSTFPPTSHRYTQINNYTCLIGTYIYIHNKTTCKNVGVELEGEYGRVKIENWEILGKKCKLVDSELICWDMRECPEWKGKNSGCSFTSIDTRTLAEDNQLDSKSMKGVEIEKV